MDSFVHFEGVRREAIRVRRRQGVLFGALFVGAFLGSIFVAEVNPGRLADGLPEIFNYFRRSLPALHWGTLTPDLAEWYWGLGKGLPCSWIRSSSHSWGPSWASSEPWLSAFPLP